MENTQIGDIQNSRDIAHAIANQIYHRITGIEGVFDTQIVYVGKNPDETDTKPYKLFVSDQDGERTRELYQSEEPIMSPTWSPDKQQVAYVSFEKERAAIYIQDLNSGVRQQITHFPGVNGAPAWSPDGRKMAMVLSKDGDPEIYIHDLVSKQFTRVTRHFAIDTEPSWTPDGRSLIFTSDRAGTPQVYRLDIESKEVRRITFKGNYNARPRLSGDGRYLVLLHGRNNRFHIAVQDLQTNNFLIVTETTQDEAPTIAPNGAMVMYATRENAQGILGVVSLDAGIRYHLPARNMHVRDPAWSP